MNGISIILTLLSGVALFLFGMSMMGDGLKRVAGNKLELVLYKLTSTPLKGILLGTAVTLSLIHICARITSPMTRLVVRRLRAWGLEDTFISLLISSHLPAGPARLSSCS